MTEHLLPPHVEHDLQLGFILLSRDNGHLRAKGAGDRAYHFKSDDLCDEPVLIALDHYPETNTVRAISHFYPSVQALVNECPQPELRAFTVAQCLFDYYHLQPASRLRKAS